MVQEFERQMIADIVEVILVDHICNFVQLDAGFLRLYFGFPTDVDHDDAFICGVSNEYGGYRNVAGCTKQNWNRLERGKLIQLIKLMSQSHTRENNSDSFLLRT
jgi:hypothetical protein